ncbi:MULTISPECIES: outer membrane beta-barrel protein [unclassified Zymobacter]|uniref:outer membrane beta-barrel protein n=1 Tax=unclassified Zymobacter TaxID=3048685 RepID=UPI0039C35932
MKLSSLALVAPVALTAAMAIGTANAADVSHGLYSGIGVNNTIAHTKDSSTLDIDKNASRAAGAFVGYKFNNWFSTEVSYNDLGEVKQNGNRGDIGTKAYGLSAIGEIPVYAGFIGYARVGAAYTQSDDAIKQSGAKHSDNTAPVYGLGLKYQFQEVPVFARVEYTRYDIDSKYKLDATNLSIGTQF